MTESHWFVVAQTRYRGTYEGGRWAAFEVWGPPGGEIHVPPEAFGSDTVAVEWWWGGPSVAVGIGETPGDALDHLMHKIRHPSEPFVPIGARVSVADAPDFWQHDGVAVVADAVSEPRLGEFAPAGASEWEYLLRFDNGDERKVPESYLRPVDPTTARAPGPTA